MRIEWMSWKALCLGAGMLALAACETQQQGAAGAGGQGAAQSTTQAAPRTAATAIVPGSQEDLARNVGDRIFFDFDKADLRPEGRAQVEKWAAWLKQYPQVTVTVEGHADERGTREYNLGLGARRADTAKRYLVQLGINPQRVATISYGKDRPDCGESNEACWQKNRRDVMKVN
ncbi:MAG: peptidoglycan-associated lipoprotein Pal [Alphaproteobacteria bacterium]|nr:peptidoglycan-associated lipoprotein Pal [Alphaproteobacteria bacterium]